MNRSSKFANIVLSALIALTLMLGAFQVVDAHATSATSHEDSLSSAPDPSLTRFVSPSGDDVSDCSDYSNPCQTINYAIIQAGSGETIGIAEGIYTGSGTEVVNINKNINLSGGWSSDFSTRTGFSTIDAENITNRKGIRIPYNVPEYNVLVEYVIVEHGSSASSGAGIYSAGNLTLQNVGIHDNQGDAINQWTGDLTVVDSSIYNNGNGIALSANQTGVQFVQVSNSTVSNNTGFGFRVDMSTTLAITGSTITNNGMAGIAVYYSQAQVTVQNSLLAGNGYYSSGFGDCTGTGATINSFGNNIVQEIPISCHFISASGDQLGVDPLLGTFLPNVGYHPLTAASPAINAGNPIGCSDHDQRGLPRDASCDIGAYEYKIPDSATNIQIVRGEGQHLGPDSYFFQPIKIVILDEYGSPVPGQTVTFSGPASGPGVTFAATGTNSITLTTDAGGVATVSQLYSKSVTGPFIIQASSTVGNVFFHIVIEIWYLSASGSDLNDCKSPSTPCATLGRIVHSPDFVYRSVVWITSDTFDLGELYFAVSKTARFEGGWNSDFTEQNSYTHIQGHIEIFESGFLGPATVIFNRFDFTSSPEDSINSMSAALKVGFNQGVLVNNSFIHDNRQGINIFGGTVYVMNTTISNNSGGPQSGGGIEIGSGFLRIINSTISGNGVLGYSMGGGIYFGGETELVIWNSTITGNKARDGGGIMNGGGPNIFGAIANTIVAGNFDSGGVANDPDCRGIIYSFGHNILGNLGSEQGFPGCGFSSLSSDIVGTYQNPISIANILNPTLVQDPLTLLWYHPLFFGSIAIDAGSPEPPQTTDTSCFATDQNGIIRPQGQVCDIGASEYVFDGTHPPVAFQKSKPVNGANGITLNPTISWNASGGANNYEFCYDTTNDNACSSWINADTSTSALLAYLAPNTTYYWQVRAVNASGITYANGSTSAFWSFKTVPPTAMPGTYDDKSSIWSYEGTWSTQTASTAYGSSYKYTSTAGSSAIVYFSGVQAKLYYTTNSSMGSLEIYIDDVLVTTINQKSSTASYKKIWQSPVYPDGVHKITFKRKTLKVNVDAIQIIPAPDLIPPAIINNLSSASGSTFGQVNLQWTAVGDDGNTGTASSYQVRYATTEIISEANWTSAKSVTGGLPVPAASGTPQTMTVIGLAPSLTYYFAIRAVDDGGNLSPLSNSPSAIALAPAPVPSGTYENLSPNWIFGGTWTTATTSGATGGSVATSSVVGSNASLVFSGSGFTLRYYIKSGNGSLAVYVDGVLKATINQKSTYFSITWKTYSLSGLTPGTHVIQLIDATSGKVNFDNIIIAP